MFSFRDNKAIALSVENLRPTRVIAAPQLALRSGKAQQPLKPDELRRVQGTHAPLEIPSREQTIDSNSI